ncbi:MAG: lasso peptide biosynthesis B2 protein [Proteobacteria bacterium]|nr:lasso peptide biosynthesis B2 protein [Pseudomonadota bacterium]
MRCCSWGSFACCCEGAPLGVVLRFGRAAAGRRAGPLASASVGGDRVAAIVRAVDRAARALPGASSCLARALVAQRLLRRAGVAAELRIGVARDGSRAGLAAHAWVVDGERVLVGDQAQPERYEPLPLVLAPRRRPSAPSSA